MKILICSHANILEPDIVYTFQEMGFEVDKFVVPIKDYFFDRNYLTLLSEKLLSSNYTFVFSVNYIPITSMVCQIHNTKYISWIADSPCHALNSKTISNKINYIFIFDQALFHYYKKHAPDSIYYLPLGSNVSRLDAISITQEEYLHYGSDVSFVGSLYGTRTKFSSITLSDFWHGYFDGLIESQLHIYGYDLFDAALTDEAIEIFNKAANLDKSYDDTAKNLFQLDLRDALINYYLGKECSHRERIRIVQELSKQFEFSLYTNDDTASYPLVHNKGIVEPFVEAYKVYKTSKVNINITSKTIKTGLPLRVFDVLGAGGFLITNYQSELPSLFEINKDLVVYESMKDLVDKVKYYLIHEEERNIIAQNGYQKVKTLYQISNQICKMFKVVLGGPK